MLLLLVKIGSTIQVIKQIGHPGSCYTQGLECIDLICYQSCGLYYQSSIRTYSIQQPSTIIKQLDFSKKKVFLEGLTLFKDTLVVLTWRQGTIYLIDSKSLYIANQTSYFKFSKEGWGIVYSETRKKFYFSNGSNIITILDEELNAIGHLRTTISYLNELQLSQDERFLYANVYTTSKILVFDLRAQRQIRLLDFKQLEAYETGRANDQFLNGFAWISQNKFLVTGKKWTFMSIVKI